jgi:SAM-dependent methyltransferase
MQNHFGEAVAARYDERARQVTAEFIDPIVDNLVRLAGAGPALEFAIGTGRIALPLASRGIEVRGIDLSEAMVARLRAKPGGRELVVTIGDISSTRVDGTFSLVYLVANTIMNLNTQDAQVACFENAATHLEPGGRFLVEVIVPGWQRLPPGERFQPFDVSPEHLGFDEIDVVTQASFSHHYWIEDGRVDVVSTPFRYAWPTELDLMARIAGMSLRDRWGGWNREPFTAESTKHVSVWERTSR